VTGRRGRRRRKLLDDLKERRGYCHLKEEALDRTTWRARFGRGLGPVVRQTTKRMNECCSYLITQRSHIRYRERKDGEWAHTYAANTLTLLERETASRRPRDIWADEICPNIMQDIGCSRCEY
jgi:hypothetical protein